MLCSNLRMYPPRPWKMTQGTKKSTPSRTFKGSFQDQIMEDLVLERIQKFDNLSVYSSIIIVIFQGLACLFLF
jgi:hypothetical protein